MSDDVSKPNVIDPDAGLLLRLDVTLSRPAAPSASAHVSVLVFASVTVMLVCVSPTVCVVSQPLKLPPSATAVLASSAA